MKKISSLPTPGAQHPAPPAPTQTLLYVEDEDPNWEVAMIRLGKRYRLHRAKNAEEACRWVRAFGGTLSAVLMDIQLHGSDLDGIQLTRLLKGTLPAFNVPAYAKGLPPITAPIVFVTANGARYGEAELLRAGGSFVVPKPVDFVQLTVGLNKLILAQRTLGA